MGMKKSKDSQVSASLPMFFGAQLWNTQTAIRDMDNNSVFSDFLDISRKTYSRQRLHIANKNGSFYLLYKLPLKSKGNYHSVIDPVVLGRFDSRASLIALVRSLLP